jgi:hypothetical protein
VAATLHGYHELPHGTLLMRIRIVRRPDTLSIDGMRLSGFEVGSVYEVGTTVGMLMLAEGWAAPDITEDLACADPSAETQRTASRKEKKPVTRAAPVNLIRDASRPYLDRVDSAADFKPPKRRR